MFEKEAEEIANKKLCSEMMCYNHCNFNSPKHHRCGEWHRCYESAKDGAEFGYNKANEWHYVKDNDLPKECSAVLCYCKGAGFKFCCVGHMLIVGGKVRWWANNKSEELLVIAWKEIVLPKKEDEKTHISKVTTTILCPTCKVPMLRCPYYGGGIYWTCGKCGYEVESTGL